MIYVFEEGNIVYDGTILTQDEKEQAVVVESLPIPEVKSGQYAVIKADKATETVYYEYVDIPKNDEIEELRALVADLTEIVLMGGL